MDRLRMCSHDNVQSNIIRIQQMFPSCVTEHIGENGKTELAIDFEKLKQELSNDILSDNEERYQFTWPDKANAIRLANTPTTLALRPDRESSKNFDTTENLYIEGDNLEVLKILQESYLGKIKMIYIDPPYNTGKDFVYEDDYAQDTNDYKSNSGQFDVNGSRLVQNTETNGRFHTDWLNMMYSRLKVSRNLLCEDGVILINMDENEITNLQKICAEIFGEQNDLGTIVWDKRNPKGDAKGISYQHEYIIVYAKNAVTLTENCKIQRPKKNAKAMIAKAKQLFQKVNGNSYTLENANSDFGEWLSKQEGLSGGEKAYNKIDENGKLYQAVSMSWPNKKQAPESYFIPLIHPITQKQCPVPERGWRNSPQTMKELQEKNMILFGVDEKTQPRRKYILDENMDENIPSLIYYGGTDVDMLKKLGIPFDTPKVVSICMEHINSFTKDGDIILDFFSGSATNAHAVMQLNKENGERRKFIMVQVNEEIPKDSVAYKAGFKTICQMGEERIKRAGKVIESIEGYEVDTGFRVLKLDSSNMNDVYYTPAETTVDIFNQGNIKSDRTNLDLLFQVMLESNVELSAKIEEKTIGGKTVYFVEDNYLVACFDKDVTESVITEIAKEHPYYFVLRDSSMASDNVADNFEQIFRAYSPDTIRKVL